MINEPAKIMPHNVDGTTTVLCNNWNIIDIAINLGLSVKLDTLQYVRAQTNVQFQHSNILSFSILNVQTPTQWIFNAPIYMFIMTILHLKTVDGVAERHTCL